MRTTIILAAAFFAIAISSFSQPVIDKTDMPQPGNIIGVSTAMNANNVDYTLTGSNYSWDFSSFTKLVQRVDTFVSVMSTPLWYYPDFNNPADAPHKATVAQKQQDITIPLGIFNIELTDVYNFYKASNSSYTQAGQAFEINGFPFPTKYNDPDFLLKFPVTIGDIDSSYYSYLIQIPTLGAYGQSRKRITQVDGWGTVITPYDTFPAMRVMSTSYIEDTIYIDTLFGFGFKIPRTEIEYKWYADNMGIPVFKATKTVGGTGNTTYEYLDKLPGNSGINELPSSLTFVNIYPNPADETTSIYFSLAVPGNIEITITDLTGRLLKTLANTEYSSGSHSIPVDESGLANGIYFVKIKSGNNSRVLKLQVM